MIRLGLSNAPVWLTLLDGVRVKVRPFTSAAFFAGQSAMQTVVVDELPADQAQGLRGLSFVKALARFAIIEWEGVVDADGVALPVTPDAIDALMDVWQAAASFEAQYQRPVETLVAEKNGSGAAPNGISAAGNSTAPSAPSPAESAPTN